MDKLAMLVLIIIAVKGSSCGDIIEVHPDCEGQTFCAHKPAIYDRYGAEIDTHVNNNKHWAFRHAMNSRLRDIQPKIKIDETNCGYIEEVHQPYTIQVNGTKLVVQSPYLEQRITITKCLDKKQSCFDKEKNQQDNIETECDESYTTITLYVYEDRQIQAREITIPVSCTCKVHFKVYD